MCFDCMEGVVGPFHDPLPGEGHLYAAHICLIHLLPCPHKGLQGQVSPHEPTPSSPVFSSSTLPYSGCQCYRNWTCQRHPCRQMQLWVPCPAWCDLLLAPWPFPRFIYFGPRPLSIPAFFREAIPEFFRVHKNKYPWLCLWMYLSEMHTVAQG